MRAAAFALLAVLDACALSDPVVDAPVDLQSWPLAAPAPAPAGGAPAPEPAQQERERQGEAPPPQRRAQVRPIDLRSVLRLTGARAIAIRTARARAREAVELARAEEAGFLPEVAPVVSFFRHDGIIQETGGRFFSVGKQNTFAGGGVDLVLRPGETIYRSLAARRRAAEAAHGVVVSQHESALEAAETYFDLVAAHAKVRIAVDARAAAREFLSVETARLEQGAGLPASVARARARLAETERDLEVARQQTALVSARLVELLALDPGVVLVPRLEDAARSLGLREADRPLPELLARAAARRPELAAAQAAVEAAEAEVARTGHGWLIPELRVGTTLGGFGPNFGGLEDQATFHAALQWRLDFGLPSRYGAAVERARRVRLRLLGLQHAVSSDVVRARSRVHAGRARVRAARQEVASAEEALKLIRTRRERGADLLLKELDAQAALTRAHTALAVAIADLNAAQYALLWAIGGP